MKSGKGAIIVPRRVKALQEQSAMPILLLVVMVLFFVAFIIGFLSRIFGG